MLLQKEGLVTGLPWIPWHHDALFRDPILERMNHSYGPSYTSYVCTNPIEIECITP